MKYEEIVEKVREEFTSADVSFYKKHLAIQFNITGEGEGAFYVEIKDGKVDVQPYEYYDRDVIFTMSAEDLFKMIDGSLDTTKAYLEHQIDVSNVTVALEVKSIIDKAEKQKATATKAKKEKKKDTTIEPIKEKVTETIKKVTKSTSKKVASAK
jgi:putative sterol carrier protein